jgi:hypothetical protein
VNLQWYKSPKSLKSFLLMTIAIVLLSFNNCGRVDFDGRGLDLETMKSTETIVGNPFASKSLLARLCRVISSCHSSVTTADCETGILKTSGIDYQLGLAKGSVKTFEDIVNAESAGELKSNVTSLFSCQTAVENLSCQDPSVQAAYLATSSNPYSAAGFMIPTSPGSCPAVFEESAAKKDVAEYYVSSAGNDFNDGSVERPWATITHASKALLLGPQGTIVHVASGAYSFPTNNECITAARPCSVTTARSGTASAPITFISDQQWGAKIIPSGANTAWYNSGEYVKIIGFEIAGVAESEFGILSEGAYSQIIGNHIHHIPVSKGCASGDSGGGIYFGWYARTHDTDAIGNMIHDIGPALVDGLPANNYCRFANGINVQQNGGRLQNNIIYKVSSSGIETWNNASRLQINHNLIFSSGHRTNAGTSTGGALLLGADSAVTIHTGTTVSNNIFRNNPGSGLRESSVGPSNSYANNVMFSNGQNYEITSGIVPAGTLTTDPLMINFKADGSGNYRLQTTSPAIDAATATCVATPANLCGPATDFAGFARPYGPSLDVGPYEWHP